ncbi:hypothetical protein [Leifsonia sp. NPDC058230]|uniref:hypothetical protein n=1 Tax=Leifsonia sp. NPDC058230 TaxID=3346391 RepID=UPI0036DD892D
MAETIEDRLDNIEGQLIQMEDWRTTIHDLGEAIEIIQRVVSDLVEGRTDNPSEYEADLDRLDKLAKFAKFMP